jgi:SAM-dependent methyltransferase
MSEALTHSSVGEVSEAIRLVCPACRGELSEPVSDAVSCKACGAGYSHLDGFWDLIVGDRFEDESDETCLCYEEVSNEYTARNYWVPLFTKLRGDASRPLRILALGCGTGVEVDVLCDAGFDCVGIDCGNRPQAWENRKYPQRLYLANGMNLPFEDDTFDIVFCGCVFPHVGVAGDSFITTDRFLDDRRKLAGEMARVATASGHIALSSPNGNCPLDLFHGRQPGSYRPRLNPPRSRFLLTRRDYLELFEGKGFAKATPLKVEGYWGFVRAKHSVKGVLLGTPIRFVFWLVSRRPFRFLRTTPLAPWLVVLIER